MNTANSILINLQFCIEDLFAHSIDSVPSSIIYIKWLVCVVCVVCSISVGKPQFSILPS